MYVRPTEKNVIIFVAFNYIRCYSSDPKEKITDRKITHLTKINHMQLYKFKFITYGNPLENQFQLY